MCDNGDANQEIERVVFVPLMKGFAMRHCLIVILASFSMLAGTELRANVVVGIAIPQRGHIPEVHDIHRDEPIIPRACWLLVGSVVAFLVYRGGEIVLAYLTERPQPSVLQWGWGGGWQSTSSNATLAIPAIPGANWLLFRALQCLELAPHSADAVKGVAHGNVICAAGRHVVGTFEFHPWDQDRNKFELIFNESNPVGIFERPE